MITSIKMANINMTNKNQAIKYIKVLDMDIKSL